MKVKENDIVKISKFMSLVLRHKPEILKLNMDGEGYVDINELIGKINEYKNISLNEKILYLIVENDEKQRYKIFNNKIRANQGHSIGVDLKLVSEKPPVVLYHGTVREKAEKIGKEGLKKMSRDFVHLSTNEKIAEEVGKRRGDPVVLRINAGKMFEEGYEFYKSENNVWMTKKVPVEYIIF